MSPITVRMPLPAGSETGFSGNPMPASGSPRSPCRRTRAVAPILPSVPLPFPRTNVASRLTPPRSSASTGSPVTVTASPKLAVASISLPMP